MTLVAAVPAVPWTRLAATAPAGATFLVVNTTVDWAAGAQVVVTPTEYDSSQTERVTVTSVTPNADGTTTLGVAPPLAFTHVGLVVDGQKGLAAGVGHLPRGILVTGTGQAASGWGAHVVVGQIVVENDFYVGRLVAQGVQFSGVGKAGRWVTPLCCLTQGTSESHTTWAACQPCMHAFYPRPPPPARVLRARMRDLCPV